MELKLDLHVHSVYSPDSFNSIDEINNRIREQGFDGYALADHDTLKGLDEAHKKSGGLVFIPAMEVSARRAHVVTLDPIEIVPAGLSLPETVDLIHDQGATAILAHPYGFPRSWPQMRQVESANLAGWVTLGLVDHTPDSASGSPRT
jgi:predicted metal-dependent phosphoesterase TrpH